jgi:hypothetical protein
MVGFVANLSLFLLTLVPVRATTMAGAPAVSNLPSAHGKLRGVTVVRTRPTLPRR